MSSFEEEKNFQIEVDEADIVSPHDYKVHNNVVHNV